MHMTPPHPICFGAARPNREGWADSKELQHLESASVQVSISSKCSTTYICISASSVADLEEL